MSEHAVRRMLEGGGGLAGRALRAALWIPGKTYGLAMLARRAAYRRRIFASVQAEVPVVSIGNLTAGGSGKTPLTVFLARELLALGRRPAIVMRGYRSTDGISDEAVLYGTLVPDAIVEVNPDRPAAAAAAVLRGADILLLDDGMQHLRLRRNLDIVLVDATSPWGGGNTMPGGLLREPKSALRTAGAVIVTRSDQVLPEAVACLIGEIRRIVPGVPLFTARHKPTRLVALNGTFRSLDFLKGRKVIALSGIARPEAFHKTLTDLGATLIGCVTGRDHDHFTPELIDSAIRQAIAAGGVVVTTEKDRAKKIFSDLQAPLADKNTMGNNNVYDALLTLGIDQDIDDKAGFIALVTRVTPPPPPGRD